MNRKFFSLILLLALAPTLPLCAQDDMPDLVTENADTPAKAPKKNDKKAAQTPAQKKAAVKLRKAQQAKKLFDKNAKARAKVKIKWESSDKKAFREAAKYNLPVWVLYSDPATCIYCVKLDNEIINSKEFKKAGGAFIGYRSASPLPQYGCSGGKPMGALFTPDKKNLGQLAYMPNQGPAVYLNHIRAEGDKILKAAEEKINAELEAAQAELEEADKAASGEE